MPTASLARERFVRRPNVFAFWKSHASVLGLRRKIACTLCLLAHSWRFAKTASRRARGAEADDVYAPTSFEFCRVPPATTQRRYKRFVLQASRRQVVFSFILFTSRLLMYLSTTLKRRIASISKITSVWRSLARLAPSGMYGKCPPDAP